MPPKKPAPPKPARVVTAHHHDDKRVNNPTNELRALAEDAVLQPQPHTFDGDLYARDPSLDPQLVWKGKDEQDQTPLTVDGVPIYIQEKIQPQALIDQIRAQNSVAQPSLFATFDGLLSHEQTVDFYRHQLNWSNRLILGDSLLVMTSLLAKEALAGQVQMIYLDPPYGIKFGSNWQASTRKRDVKDGKWEDTSLQPEQIKAFRDTWELGIHSYLSYLRDRLVAARELLTESGSIFVQISDKNVHLVRCLMDEVFGSGNFVSQITFTKTRSLVVSEFITTTNDFLLWYAKNRDQAKFRRIFKSEANTSLVSHYQDEYGVVYPRAKGEKIDGNLSSFMSDNLIRNANPKIQIQFNGKTFTGSYRTTKFGMERLAKAGRLLATENQLRSKFFLSDFPVSNLNTVWSDVIGASDITYVVQTNTKVIERCMLMTTDPGDLVLDPTCGSGTTAYVAEQWGRRWITIDTSRVALALARTRLMTAVFPYYLLQDSADGLAKEAALKGEPLPNPRPEPSGNLHLGFVYKRVPHITLRDIANNAEIDTLWAKWQEPLEALRAELNTLLAEKWEEWQIPREGAAKWPQGAQEKLRKWWDLRLQRQREIDASIARSATVELLYDQPYEDKQRVRVSGPFTVESISPHRMIACGQEVKWQTGLVAAEKFVGFILGYLRRTGVQNTKQGQRLEFTSLTEYAGPNLHAEGEYLNAAGETQRVALCVGPEYGTVGDDLVWAAVKEAAKGTTDGQRFDLLLVCGFAFEGDMQDKTKTKKYGRLPVLLVKMSPELLMGEVKLTGAGNLFLLFGEPDLELTRQADGQLVVTIRGLDIYNPLRGFIIHSTPEDNLVCWFIDTDYNEESFFVRQAYFTGGNAPYDKLKRTLRTEVSEEAWAKVYSTVSLPFPEPKSGRFAVKVINHFGDEVLKVYDLRKLERELDLVSAS